MRDINTLVIHHSASPSGNVVQFRAEHRARGWADIGYHEVICNGQGGHDGEIEAGRPHNIEGAAVFGNNRGKLHVCLVGNFQAGDAGYTGKPTVAQIWSLGYWLLVNGHRYNIKTVTDHKSCAIEGHATLCPGDQFPTHFIQQWYEVNIKAFHPNTPPPNLAAALEAHGYWKNK